MRNNFLIPIFFLGSIGSFFLSLFIPIYQDEFDWRLISSRLFIDHKLVWVFPSCLRGFWLDIPITWYPYLFFEGLTFQGAHDLQLLRLIGCLIFVIILCLIVGILKAISGLGLPTSLLLVVGYFSLGVVPFSMVLNRPEQELNILVCLSILIAVTLKKGDAEFTVISRKILLLAIFSLIVIFMLGAHPKGIFFLPITASAYWLVSKSKKLFAIFCMICIATSYQTIRLWGIRTQCEENTWLNFRNLTINPAQLIQDPVQFIQTFGTNVKNSFIYIKYIYIQDHYQSNWLAIDPEFHLSLNSSFVQLVNISMLAMTMICFIFFMLSIRRIANRKNYDYSLISIAIAMSLLLLSGMQSGKNFYEANWFWVLIFLLFILSLDFSNCSMRRITKNYIITFLLIIGIVSSALRIIQFYPSLPAWKIKADSYSLANTSAHKNQLKDFAKDQCDINENSTGLVLETLTYPSFWNHPKPYFIIFLTGWWGTGTNYPNLLRSENSGGMILQCSNIPPEYLKYTKRNDQNYCCVSGGDLNKVKTIKN